MEGNEQITFTQYNEDELKKLTSDQVRQNLQSSGLWTALRTRPFSKEYLQ